jgi:hypothetical protein
LLPALNGLKLFLIKGLRLVHSCSSGPYNPTPQVVWPAPVRLEILSPFQGSSGVIHSKIVIVSPRQWSWMLF